MEQDYYHKKVNVRVAECLITLDLRKLVYFMKIHDMLGINSGYPVGHPKTKSQQLC